MATQSSDQLLVNRLCYCGKGLREFRYAGEEGYICRNCCRRLTADDNVTYGCQAGYCLFGNISTINYWLCSTCYRQSGIRVDIKEIAYNQNDFIYRKFQFLLKATS